MVRWYTVLSTAFWDIMPFLKNEFYVWNLKAYEIQDFNVVFYAYIINAS